MMEDVFYNILWIDDDHESLTSTKGRAKSNGLNLIGFKSLNSGMSELERNLHFYDGILLDAKFYENDDDINLHIEDTYKALIKNCSNPELVNHRSYFVRHPMELRTELRATCNWTVDWYANRSDAANKERTIILKNVRHFL